jgi:hypothetical protein
MSGASIGHAGRESSPHGSLDAGSGSLPRPLTSFIGRERELAEARRLLDGSCLLTLARPGGSGMVQALVSLSICARSAARRRSARAFPGVTGAPTGGGRCHDACASRSASRPVQHGRAC